MRIEIIRYTDDELLSLYGKTRRQLEKERNGAFIIGVSLVIIAMMIFLFI